MMLGGLDNSSVQLTIEKLNGKNFREWAQSMKLFIDGKRRLGYLTGEVKKPEDTDPPALEKWQSENSMVISWLVNSMKPAIGKTYMFLPTAKDVWIAVHETYSDTKDLSQIFKIKTRLWQMKQGNQAVTDYYTEMLSLWQELDLSFEEAWGCTGDSARYNKKLEYERVFEFLAGLNHELDEVRGRILSRRPLPSTREVFSEVRREEQKRKVMMKEGGNTSNGLTGSDGSALLTRGIIVPNGNDSTAMLSHGPQSGTGQNHQRRRPWCEHCQTDGHTKDIC